MFLPPKSGTTAWNPPRFARSFLKRPAPNGKTPSKSRGTNVLTLLSDSEGVSCPGDCLPSAVASQVHVHPSKVINEWYSGSRSLGNQKSRDKYPRYTLSYRTLRAAAERKPHHQGENERLPNVAHDLPLSPTHGQGVYVGSSGLTSTPKQSLFPYGHAPGSVVLWCRLLPDPLSMMTS